MDDAAELTRLLHGPRSDSVPSGAGLVTLTATAADAADVLHRAREVLEAVLRTGRPSWPRPEEWAALLPLWFVEACGDDDAEEAEAWLRAWRNADAAGRASAEEQRTWTLQDWLFWLRPEERQWSWWDGMVTDRNLCTVQVEVRGWPVPLGALGWLLRAAGADAVEDDA